MGNGYADRHLVSTSVNLTTTTDQVVFAPLNQIVVHRVGIYLHQLGSTGINTNTFQKTVSGLNGTDTTIKAIVVDESDDAVIGAVIYGNPTTPVVVGPGECITLSCGAEASGTASADAFALVEYSLLDVAVSDDSDLIATD